jgi:adenine-specific DNA-methyltransferase
VETVNYYAAFVALALLLLEPKGQLVAIIPRSFCNGPYFRAFRRLLMSEAVIARIHLYRSRTSVFRGDGVLQENVILHLRKQPARQRSIIVSWSEGDDYSTATSGRFQPQEIIPDPEGDAVISIPHEDDLGHSYPAGFVSPGSLGLEVSTGPVVDFRVRTLLRDNIDAGCVPLVYPQHMKDAQIVWPKDDSRKPNALFVSQEVERSLFPVGAYVIVRRFSSKEERRRIVASLVSRSLFGQFPGIAFENHVNVFHMRRHGLCPELAQGLTAYLNSHFVDRRFRVFSGHTQVNASDLRSLRYPSASQLADLGRLGGHWAGGASDRVDAYLDNLCSGVSL